MSKEKFVRDKPHVNIGTIILIIFGITSLSSFGMLIFADVMETRDSDGDSIPDLEELSANHPLFYEASDNILSFRTYESTTGHELGHNLGISHGGFSSHVNVLLNLYDDVSKPIPIVDFNIKYDSLIEFVDNNANGFFDPTVDTVVGKTTLDNMIRTGVGFGVDGEPAYYSSYSTISGLFKVDFYTSREHVLLSRQVGLLAPYELKSVITITEYLPITGGTMVALNLSLSSSQGIDFSGLTSSALTSIGNYKAVYEWYDTATINDVQTTVNTTVPSSPIPLNSGQIYINFGNVVNATYDPKLHWELPSTPSFNIFTDVPWSYITIGSLAALSITAAVSHVARKRPGRVKYSDIPPSQKSSETITQDKNETREEKKKKSKSSSAERFGQQVLSDSDF
ncbi:MAG: hypothetical protein EAX91_17130 [Candidatus Lokiarchaeota archaeon]|nr:hypothetical protein [Candidatus Lokiarchaeota archaeon]